MGKINLLYDHHVFSAQQYGGVSRMFINLIRFMAQSDQINLHLFHGLHINRFPLKDLKNQLAFYSGTQIPPLPYANLWLKPLNRHLFKLKVPGKNIDLYHPTRYHRGLHLWNRCPVILTVCDMIPEKFPGVFHDLKPRLRAKRESIQRADHIITISQATKKDLLEYYANDIGETPITPIHLGAPEPLPEPVTPPFSHPRPYILHVGTRKQSYKNYKALLTAYASSPSLMKDYDLVTFGGPPFTADEHKTKTPLGCRDNVFHVRGGDTLLAAVYRGASLLVYPSLYEGFGLPLLEAMAYHCPVAASRTAAIPEVAGDAALYFDPTGPTDILKAMESVLSNPTLAKELVEKGARRVKAFSWPATAQKTLEVYKTCLDH